MGNICEPYIPFLFLAGRRSDEQTVSGDEQVKNLILQYLETVESCKVEDLVALIEKQHNLNLSKMDIVDIIQKLDEEEVINLTRPSFLSFIGFLATPIWSLDFWLVTIAVAASIFSIFLIPAQLPLVYLRSGLGLAFLLYLPGYSLVEFIFPSGRDPDKLEKMALQVGLSVAIVLAVGLSLSLTPLGLGLDSTVATMGAFTLFLIGLASYKKYNLFFSRRE